VPAPQAEQAHDWRDRRFLDLGDGFPFFEDSMRIDHADLEGVGNNPTADLVLKPCASADSKSHPMPDYKDFERLVASAVAFRHQPTPVSGHMIRTRPWPRGPAASSARISADGRNINGQVRVVHIIRDAVPGLVLVLVLAVAALPAERIAGSSTRGRARTAVAYLAGFGSGLFTSALVATFAALRSDPQPLGALTLLGSFVGPFVGLASASFHRPRRRQRRTES
jgi:hypothetical protein